MACLAHTENTPHTTQAHTQDTLRCTLSTHSPSFPRTPVHDDLESGTGKILGRLEFAGAQRKILLDRRRVDGKAVDENLIQNNTTTEQPFWIAPAHAPLARIPVTQSLRVAGILIYAVIGRFAPYVGQLGGKTRRARTPLRRLMEHAAGSKNLQRHFTGQRKRNLRTQGKLGNRHTGPGGHSQCLHTPVAICIATRQNLDARENLKERILAPTLNGVTPYRGYRHILEWPYGDVQIPKHK